MSEQDFYYEEETPQTAAETPQLSRAQQQAIYDQQRFAEAQKPVLQNNQSNDTVKSEIAETIRQELAQHRTQVEAERVIAEYQAKHPELIPYSDHIALEVEKVRQQTTKEGKSLAFREELDLAVKNFTEKFSFPLASSKQDMRKTALTMDGSGSRPGPEKDVWEQAIENNDRKAFEQLWAQNRNRNI